MSHRSSRLPAVAVWLGLAAAAAAADPPAPAVLHLADAGRLPGELVASDDPGVWRWRSPAFARPLDFPLAAVRSVEYAVPPAAPRPAGEYSVELAGGDVVYGDLAAITDDVVELAGTAAGRLRLRRDQVRRYSRWNGNGTVYVGPTGLTGWTRADGQWREDGGHLVTDKPGADLWADLGVPDKALVEVGLSWVGKPDFTLAVGVDDKAATARRAFRFEVWDGELVAVGESAKDADLAVIQPAPAGGQARVRVLLDQPARRLTVLGPTGKAVAALAIAGDKPAAFGGVRLVNGKGDVRLEHLRVARWDGRPPPEVAEGRPWVGRTDGSVVYGEVTAYDPAAKRFTVRDGETETAVPHDAVADVYPAPPPPGPPASRAARVVLRDGTRVSGRPTGVADAHLTLDCPGVQEPIRLPLAAVRSVVLVQPTAKAAQVANGRGGRLEADGLSLPGRLEGGDVPAGGLLWRPELGRTAAPLAAGFAGRIVYRDPAPPPPAPPVAANAPGRVIIQRFDGPAAPPAAPVVRLPASGRKSLHLRTGDAVPCEVTRIDERGVTLTSPQSDVTFVPHDKVKCVELVAARDAPGLDEAKRDRLLTLPRSQKDSPPTHLVCSTTGDFLRGRVVEMDDTHLTVEVRLETKTVPRDRVAQVVWLHPDELAADPPAPPAAGPGPMRAQVVHADGRRLTFIVGGSDGNTLSGTSEVLGACRVPLVDVDQVLLGGAVARSAADLAYHPWRLRPAAEPKAAQPGGDGDGGSSGLESPLVGQPAPAVELKLLDGTPYKLAGRKGRVVVLDFWASWCGPCVQSMPLVDEVVREFADRGVELLAVNLEEPPEKARGLLDRLKLTVPVALDRDGAVAAKYGVTSIPQAVVIGRDGKVARLYVGGGKAAAEALRAALKELTAKPPD